MNRLLKAFFYCLGAGWLAAMPLQAANYSWNFSDGYVNDSLHWLPNTGIPGGAAADNATIANGGTTRVDGTRQFAGPFDQLTVNESALTLETGANVQIAGGKVGGDNTAGVSALTIGDESVFNATGQFNIGRLGNAHVVISGTSTTAPATLSIGGVSYIGFNEASTPSTALIELSGTGEMRLGVAGATANTHVGLGAGSTATISMTDDSKLIFENVPGPNRFQGWLQLGDLGGTAIVELSGHASVDVTKSCVGMGSSPGATAHITLNDSATFSSKGYISVGLSTATEASITLNGGTFTAPQFVTEGPGVINFNGGTIKASAASSDFFSGSSFTINLKDGGGTLDTNTFDITVAQPIRDGFTSAPGTFTKTGLGNLTLISACTYTGPTVVKEGMLTLGEGSLASSGIIVKNGATLSGHTNPSVGLPYPLTTVEKGGTLAPNSPTQVFYVDALQLEDGAKMSFKASDASSDYVMINNDVSPTGTATPANVSVSILGAVMSNKKLLEIIGGGTLSSNVHFRLSDGVPALDSPDGINAPASLFTQTGTNGYVELRAGGALSAIGPYWNVAGDGNWSDATKWGPSGNVPNTGLERGLFIQNLGGATINVTLNADTTVSSLVFGYTSGSESYNIVPTGTQSIALKPDASFAQNWHITVLSGSHTVGAKLKLGAGTGLSAGQSIIRLADDTHLTLSGALGDDTTAAGINFVGNFNGEAGTGTLTLSGANTYTGTTTVEKGILVLNSLGNVGVANTLGMSPADAASLSLKNATLKCAAPAGQATDRGMTLVGNVTLQFDNNVGLTGQFVGAAPSELNIAGPGSLTYGYTGAAPSTVGNTNVNTALTIDTNAKLQIDWGQIGCLGNTGSLTVNEGGSMTAADWCDMGNEGNAHIVLASTSTTSPAVFSIAGNSWIGFNGGGGAGMALVELSGTAELHLGTAGPAANTHLGLGAGSTGTISMMGHSKATFENTAVQQFQGWFQVGDLGGTAIVNLSDFASFELTKSSVGIGSSVGATGRIILNDSAAFSSKGFVFVGLGTATEASITLNGGTFTAPQFVTEGPGQIKFNGGVLKASAASDDYIAGATFALNVDAGGAKIDTNGFDIAIAREFHNISATTPGGLTKLGDGKLTLTVTLVGIGDTTVNQGELNAAAGINTPFDTVYVATGATLTAPTIVADTLTIGGLPKGAAVAVPEPGTLALLAMAGLISVWFAIRRKR